MKKLTFCFSFIPIFVLVVAFVYPLYSQKSTEAGVDLTLDCSTPDNLKNPRCDVNMSGSMESPTFNLKPVTLPRGSTLTPSSPPPSSGQNPDRLNTEAGFQAIGVSVPSFGERRELPPTVIPSSTGSSGGSPTGSLPPPPPTADKSND